MDRFTLWVFCVGVVLMLITLAGQQLPVIGMTIGGLMSGGALVYKLYIKWTHRP